MNYKFKWWQLPVLYFAFHFNPLRLLVQRRQGLYRPWLPTRPTSWWKRALGYTCAPAAPPQPQPQSPLLSLPIELRLRIYDFLISEDTLHLSSSYDSARGPVAAFVCLSPDRPDELVHAACHHRPKRPLDVSFVFVCRQITAETLPLLYRHPTFDFTQSFYLFFWANHKIAPEMLREVRRLRHCISFTRHTSRVSVVGSRFKRLVRFFDEEMPKLRHLCLTIQVYEAFLDELRQDDSRWLEPLVRMYLKKTYESDGEFHMAMVLRYYPRQVLLDLGSVFRVIGDVEYSEKRVNEYCDKLRAHFIDLVA